MTERKADIVKDRIIDFRRVPAGELRPDPSNPRRHPTAQRSALATMLDEVGFAGAILARETADGLVIVDGHLRADTDPEALLPVLVTDLDPAEAAKVLATYDPIGAMAETDTEALRALLDSVTTESEDVAALLKRVEFDARLIPETKPKHEEPPEASDTSEALQAKWGTERGQVWAVGRHRIMCGDSFEEEDMARLVGPNPVDAVLTDPPFAIYGSSSGIASSIADDKMVRPFFVSLFRLIRSRLKVFGHAYVHCDWRSWAAVWEGARSSGVSVKNCLVWDKGNFGLGANYPNAHEFVGFFANLPPDKTMTSQNAGGQRQVLTTPNILRFDRPRGDDRHHNAAKPVPMLELLMANSTEEGERILDPFLGSASALVAAERSGRAGLGMEMEPKWVAVSLERLSALGLRPELAE